MVLHFIFSHLHSIALIFQIMFAGIIALRYYRGSWLKNISFQKIALIIVGFNIAYGAFVTWGQYHVWATSVDWAKLLVEMPLSPEAPLPSYLEWTRTFFQNSFGYFLYYVLGRVWLPICISFAVSGLLYAFFRFWKSRRGGFIEQGPELLLGVMLVSGWPGVLICVSAGFIVSVAVSTFFHLKDGRTTTIEPIFIFMSLVFLFLSLIF